MKYTGKKHTFPPKGTVCWVWDNGHDCRFPRISNGKGQFGTSQHKGSGEIRNTENWGKFEPADGKSYDPKPEEGKIYRVVLKDDKPCWYPMRRYNKDWMLYVYGDSARFFTDDAVLEWREFYPEELG